MMDLYFDRFSGYARYPFKRVPDGWLFDLAERSLVSDYDGMDFFEYLRIRDQFSYPSSIGCYFEHWWDAIREGTLSYSEVQEQLNELCVWLSECERTKPKW